MNTSDTRRLVSTVDEAKGFVKESVDNRRSIRYEFMTLNINHPDYHIRAQRLAYKYYNAWKEENKCRQLFKMGPPGYLPDWVNKLVDVREE